MPRFFLHVRKPDGSCSVDYEGSPLTELAEAETEAFEAVRDLRRHFSGATLKGWYIEIATAKGDVLRSIPFSEVPE